MTVINEEVGDLAAALLAPEGTTDAPVTNVTVRAQGNNTTNYGIYLFGGGTATASNSRPVGGAVYGTVTCVAVSRGTTFNANGCP